MNFLAIPIFLRGKGHTHTHTCMYILYSYFSNCPRNVLYIFFKIQNLIMNHKLNFLLNPEQFSQLCMLQGGGMEIGREGQTEKD